MSKASGSVREWLASLLLGGGLIYMLNATMYRPSQFSRDRHIVEALVMHEEAVDSDSDSDAIFDDDDEETCPVIADRGLLFFGTIVFDKVPRGSKQALARFNDPEELAAAYKQPTMGHLKRLFGSIVEVRNKNTGRVSNRSGPTRDINYVRAPRPPEQQVHFGLAAKGVVAKPPLRMSGQDIGSDSEDEVIRNAADMNIDKLVTGLWEQFPFDIIATAPNPREINNVYLLLNRRQRTEVDIDLFMTLDLRGVFKTIQYKVYTPAMWEQQFNLYFPPKQFNWTHRQNFKNATYYKTYVDLIQRLDRHQLERVRNSLKKEFNKLKWIPAAEGDRMWSTRDHFTSGWERVPKRAAKGPALAVNGRLWDWDVGVKVGGKEIGVVDEDQFDGLIRMEEEEGEEVFIDV